MIAFFRRALSSWLVLGLLGLILIAFVITGVKAPDMLGSGRSGSGDAVARVGKTVLQDRDVSRRIQLQMANMQRENPAFDTTAFVAGGGVEQTVAELVDAAALYTFGRQSGLTASRRLVDGEIASVPSFAGASGKFDDATFQSFLQQQRMTEHQLREDVEGDLLRRQLLAPVGAIVRIPSGVASLYASLLLEAREGTVGFVPAAAMASSAAATPAEVQQFYARNLLRYTLPERRVIRYASFGREQLGAAAEPSAADIERFYTANADTYGPKEMRVLSQVVLPTEAAARAVAARVKAGTPFAAAAGPSAVALGEQTRANLAGLSTPEIAAAAFALPAGGTTDPARSDFGWHVVHVDTIHTTPGRPLAAVRAEIAASLGKQRVDEALAKLVDQIQDRIEDGASFDDIAKSQKLNVVTSPPLTADGGVPGQPGVSRPPEERLLAKGAFQMTPDDEPVVETIGAGQRYALMQVAEVVPAAPRLLAEIQDAVKADMLRARAAERARAVATAIVAKVNAGMPMAQAFAGAGVPLPPLQKAGGRRMEFARGGTNVPPPLKLMFSMVGGKARMLPAAGGGGWYVVRVDRVVPGNAATSPGLVEATRNQFSGVFGDELVQQFAAAARGTLKVEQNAAAIARLKGELSGTAGAQ